MSSSNPGSERSYVADRLMPFGTSIFAEVTRLAIQHGAVNLAQGFPDFDGPEIAKSAAIEAIRSGTAAQYSPMTGVAPLRQAIAQIWHRRGFAQVDPESWITVTCGCSEAIVASMMGLMNPGDEVVIFEPYFDFYAAAPAMGGFVPRFVAIRPTPDGSANGAGFSFDPAELRAAFTKRTKAILFNTPHNPTGKVFSRAEMQLIADLCIEHDVVAISDEVYEHLVYEPSEPHVPLASMPGMIERTITLSSVGKSFSLTGWKVGWAVAPPKLSAAVRAAHQFITFATNTPLQHGVAAILHESDAYITELVTMYRENRDALTATLRELGLTVYPSAGTYFVMADHTPISARLGLADDRAFCRYLTEKIGVAALPPTAFYDRQELGRPLVRFAFCKKRETMGEAIRRLRRMGG
jgi:aspartate/methionine/tyrosine aminotransferase